LVGNATYNRAPAAGVLLVDSLNAALAHSTEFTPSAVSGLGQLKTHLDFVLARSLSRDAFGRYFAEQAVGVTELRASSELSAALRRAGVSIDRLTAADGGDGLVDGSDWETLFTNLAGARNALELKNANGRSTPMGDVVSALSTLASRPSMIPGLPPRLVAVREKLINGGRPYFNAPYPPDETIPAAVKAMKLVLPFAQGAKVVCSQSNNSMFTPATHGPSSLRYALDFEAPDQSAGLPVTAATGGTAYVYGGGRPNKGDNYGLGNLVIIDHHNGYATLYSHLGAAAVRTGQTVRTGQRVGAVGDTGLAGSNHLHFQVVKLLRTPDPASETYQAEPGGAPPREPPFGAAVRYLMEAKDVTAGAGTTRIDSTQFHGGESGYLPLNARTYSR